MTTKELSDAVRLAQRLSTKTNEVHYIFKVSDKCNCIDITTKKPPEKSIIKTIYPNGKEN